MLPGLEHWLAASWNDFRRRWPALMLVLAAGGLATAAAAALPLLPALAATLAGWGSPWLCWGGAGLVSLTATLLLSTWAQAALMRAAAADEGAGLALSRSWGQLAPFAWVFSLYLLAVGGGLLLLLLPGLLLAAALGPGLYYQLEGEAQGMDALELSWGRFWAAPAGALARLLVAGLVASAPGWIPLLGWLIGPLWAPIGLVACARLAADLKALTPAPPRPRFLRPVVVALSLLLLAAAVASSWGLYRLASFLRDGGLAEIAASFRPPDAETAQALLATVQGSATPEQSRRALEYALSLSSSSETFRALLWHEP